MKDLVTNFARLSTVIAFSLVLNQPAFGRDLCQEFSQKFGPDKTVRCNMTGMRLKGESARILQVNCDDPNGSDYELVGYIDQTKSISSIEGLRVKLLEVGAKQSKTVAELTAKAGAPDINSFIDLPARKLCPKGTQPTLSCDDLNQKIPALELFGSLHSWSFSGAG